MEDLKTLVFVIGFIVAGLALLGLINIIGWVLGLFGVCFGSC